MFAGDQNNIMPDSLPSLLVIINIVVKMAASIPRNFNYKTTGLQV